MSWFMRCINESVARRANREDRCTGRFWEGRFKSQALLDERALLQCMAYVDLNPVRAAVAATPEESLHTSVHRRIHRKDGNLMPFDPSQQATASIPFTLPDYLNLVDQTGRILREDKRGAIAADLDPILSRLGLEGERWLLEMRHYGTWYGGAVGTLHDLKAWCTRFGRKWMKGPPLDLPSPGGSG